MGKTRSKLHGLQKSVKALSSPGGALIEVWQKLRDVPLEDKTLQVTHDGKEQGAVKAQRRQPAFLKLRVGKRRSQKKRRKKI